MALISNIRSRSALIKSSCLSLLALSVPGAWAQAPAIVADAQQTIASGYNGPQGFAGNNTNNGAIFIADTSNNQLVILYNGVSTPVTIPGYTLVSPQAVAIDVLGNVFIADTPSSNGTSYGRIIELPENGGSWNGTAQVVFSGAPLSNPISLAVDGAGTLFIGDYPLASGNGAIYSLAAGATTPTLLTLTGVPATLTPAGLVRDSSTNLYFTDNGAADGSNNGGVYKVPATGGTATPVNTQSFVINQPSGLTLDAAGNLYIASLIGSGSTGQQVVVVPAAAPTAPYILPNTGINSAAALSFDPHGNLDVLSSVDGGIYQLTFGSSINLGYSSASAPGVQLLLNFEFNTPITLRGFAVVTGGDASTEVSQVYGGTCANGSHATNGSGAVTTYNPYTCNESYEGTPKYPGIRNSAIQIKGPGNTILASVPVYQISVGGAQVTYPFTANATAGGLQVPQAVAISGLDKTVYVADTAAGAVYSVKGLGGSTLTQVSTGSITLVAPSALAVDGAGNLFIADFGGTNPGQLVEVPISGTPSVVNTGSLLQHPISLTVNTFGDLYIGDAGPGGINAGTGNPGFVIRIPAGGTAAKLNTPIPIVFPQALVTNFYTNFLFVGDGGDPSSTGQVDVFTADGTEGGMFGIAGNLTDPTALAFDPAGNLYILDGVANSITVDPIYLNDPQSYTYTLSLNNTAINSASAMALSAGGQSFVISNVGNGATNNLFYINGSKSTLAFGGVSVNTQSQTMTATVANIGNATLNLGNPYESSTTTNAAFSLLNSSTCTNSLALSPGSTCTVNVQFTPASTGQTSQQFTFPSDGYNNGVPVLTVQGTGKK